MKIEQLSKNVDEIKRQIAENKSDNQDVKLIAVTKYVDSDVLRQLYELGIRDFGENRSDELLRKQEELSDIANDIEWHFIGQLQRRPVRKIINRVSYLHSLDRMSLIKEVNKRATSPVDSFLQVNISGEEQKAGFEPEEVLSVIEKLSDYPNIRIVGLMTMAPYEATEKELRYCFSELRNIQERVKNLKATYAPCTHLSMGMSRDFTIAVQEGASMVRIGSSLYKD